MKTIANSLLRAILKNKGSANRPRMDQLKIFLTFFITKSELKGVHYMKKIANSCRQGSKMQTISNNWGCLPIGPNQTNSNICQQFFVQNLNLKRLYLMEKLTSSVFRAPCGLPFWFNTCLPTGQIWGDQFIFNNLNLKYKIILVPFYVKICYN